ncbi:MAG TPA: glycosyltransferase family 4 protein [Bryobacteraceae bacterium]|nr:glycosyltransferase family 4 protein [Bryobacteraceae bacterium]
MRVLHLDSGKEMRGGQWQVLSLLRGLGAGNLLLTPADGPLMVAAQACGLQAEPLTMLSLGGRARQFDLVHAHDARSHTWAATLPGVPIVVSRRVGFPVQKTFLSRWKYGRASRYLAVSEHVKRTLVEAEIPEEKISVVYDGVDCPSAVASGQRVIAPATLDPMKGSDLAQEAARLARVDLQFSTNLPADLPSAALLVYITRSEGLGSAALLAMAHGVPVVASRVGGLPEIVNNCETGILTDNEPAAIAAAIRRALILRERLSANARRCIEEQFSSKNMIEKTREVYDRVVPC